MSHQYRRHRLFSEFRQACRAHRPNELVRAIARQSALIPPPPYNEQTILRMPPWGLAIAARESLLYGNEYRSKPVTENSIATLMKIFQQTFDDDALDARDDDLLVKLMTPIAYEQFPYQESIFEELSRSYAWMLDGLGDVQTDVITEETLAAMLDGVPLPEAIGAAFFLSVGASENQRLYRPEWLDQPNFAGVLELYSRSSIERMARRLTTDIAGFKAAFSSRPAATPKSRRFDYGCRSSRAFPAVAPLTETRPYAKAPSAASWPSPQRRRENIPPRPSMAGALAIN